MSQRTKKILIVDDEPKIIEVLKSFLESKGFFVLYAETGDQALEIFQRDNIALILLDLMLPGISGEEVCKAIRQYSRVPIIMLTAKIEEENLLEGLGIGADDYITKPFSLKALYARIEAVMRRSGGDPDPLLHRALFNDRDLVIDFDGRTVRKNHTELKLTPNEFNILSALAKYPNKVFTRDELIRIAFNDEFEGFDRTVDSHIKNLRKKIETDPKKPIYVLTMHGIGYKFGS